MERGRTDYLREIGFEQASLGKDKIVFVVKSINADYLSTAY
jgi:acyl-CoA thioesterase FadM